jgi:hypothetical protein
MQFNSKSKKKLNKSNPDSVSDYQKDSLPNRRSKGFRKQNLEGGEGSSDSNKKKLLGNKFNQAEILRENTKKTGLKSFEEDKKTIQKDGDNSLVVKKKNNNQK